MTLEGTNTYVVGRAPAYVIDPGPAIDSHVEAIQAAAADRGGIGGILLTHSHTDHSEAAPKLDAPLLWGEIGDKDETGAGPVAAEEGALGFRPDSPGPRTPSSTSPPALETCGPFRVIPTPGHAADHVCFVLEDVCFCGDLVLGEGSSYVPPDGGSLAAYMDSLGRVRELEPTILCPGHGPWITDPAAKLGEYLQHRLERERRLVTALEAGERSRTRLLDAAWSDVPAELRPAAAMVMQAHLEKLAADARLPAGLASPAELGD